jgi:hypothetical protein
MLGVLYVGRRNNFISVGEIPLYDNFKRHQLLKRKCIGELVSLLEVPVISAEKLLEDQLPLWS